MQLRRAGADAELLHQIEGVIAGQAGQVEILGGDEQQQHAYGGDDAAARQRIDGSRLPLRLVALLMAVPLPDLVEHAHGQQGQHREPGQTALAQRQHDQRRQQRAHGGAAVAADLEDGLRQPVAATGGHPRYARGLRVENRRADADHGRAEQQQREGGGAGEQQQAGERRAHANHQRIGLGMLVGVETDQRLQQRGGGLVGQGQQTDLGEVQIVVALKQRVDGDDQ